MFSSVNRTPARSLPAVRSPWQFATVALLLLSPAVASASQIFGNGSFESPPITTGYESTSTDLWTLSNAHVTSSAILNSCCGGSTTAADGVLFATLNANGSVGSVSQTFDTVASQTYTVSFAQNQFYDGRSDSPYPPQPTSVNLTAQVVAASVTLISQNYTYNRGTVNNGFATDPTWAGHSFSFIATGSSATLSFIGNTASALDFGQAIDNVTVVTTVAAPEPASLTLLALGTLGLMIAIRRRRG